MTSPLCQKEKSERVGLKLNIQKMKIMTSGPITSWEIDGETMETVTDFVFCNKGNVICISVVIDIPLCNLDPSLCFIQPGISLDVLCIQVK